LEWVHNAEFWVEVDDGGAEVERDLGLFGGLGESRLSAVDEPAEFHPLLSGEFEGWNLVEQSLAIAASLMDLASPLANLKGFLMEVGAVLAARD
jgi:hypothetical protein